MSADEHANEPGDGDGGGLGTEDITVVEVSRNFLIGSLGRTSSALYGAGDVCLDARALVTAGEGAPALADLIEQLYDLSEITAGMARALERLEFKEE